MKASPKEVKQLLAIRAQVESLMHSLDALMGEDAEAPPEGGCLHDQREWSYTGGMGGGRTWTCPCGASGNESSTKKEEQP